MILAPVPRPRCEERETRLLDFAARNTVTSSVKRSISVYRGPDEELNEVYLDISKVYTPYPSAPSSKNHTPAANGERGGISDAC